MDGSFRAGVEDIGGGWGYLNGSFKVASEDIWGGLGDIWVAALGQEVRISGLEVVGMGVGVWVAV